MTTGETGILADIRSASNLRFIAENFELQYVKAVFIIIFLYNSIHKGFFRGKERGLKSAYIDVDSVKK